MDAHDVLAFRTSARRVFGFNLVVAALSWAAVQPVVWSAFGHPAVDVALVAGPGALYAVSFSTFTHFAQRANWASVDVTGQALRLVERGRTAVFPWHAIRSATIERPGPFAVLRVTLRPDAVVPVAPTLRPRRRAGQPVFTVGVGPMRPGTGDLRAALDRHLATRPVR